VARLNPRRLQALHAKANSRNQALANTTGNLGRAAHLNKENQLRKSDKQLDGGMRHHPTIVKKRNKTGKERLEKKKK
jgi:hypothetical protein